MLYKLPSILLYHSSRVSRIPSPKSAGLVRSIQVWSGQIWFDQIKPELVGPTTKSSNILHDIFSVGEQNC